MRKMNLLIIVLIILALFITGYIFIKKAFPANPTQEESIKYSFPVSKDIPKAKSKVAPTYDLPSVTLPEPEPATDQPPAEVPPDTSAQ